MENGFIKCKSCGTELTPADNFCPNCGTKCVNEPAKCKVCGKELTDANNFCPNCGVKRSRKEKNPLFQKWWFWLIILVVIGVIVSAGKDNTSESVPTTSLTPEVVEPATYLPQESISKAEKIDSMIAIIEDSIKDYPDYFVVEGNETGITLFVNGDDLVDDIIAAVEANLDENYEPWVEVKTSMLYLCFDIMTCIPDDIDYIEVTVKVICDGNPDYVLLEIADGIIIFDIMAI